MLRYCRDTRGADSYAKLQLALASCISIQMISIVEKFIEKK